MPIASFSKQRHVVDEGRLTRLLRGVAERADRLRDASTIPTIERSTLWLDGVKYLFVTAIEGCVDVAQHIVSSEGFGVPSTNADAVRIVALRGVIPVDLGEELSRAVGFRNVLVHQYAVVDDGIVIAALDRTEVFDEFVAAVAEWLLAQTEDSP